MSNTDRPFVEVTIQIQHPLPEGTTEEEAIEAAKQEFGEPPAERNATIDYRYEGARNDE